MFSKLQDGIAIQVYSDILVINKDPLSHHCVYQCMIQRGLEVFTSLPLHLDVRHGEIIELYVSMYIQCHALG